MQILEGEVRPDNITTQVAEYKVSSEIGLPRRRMVSVGQTLEGETFVQLGSVAQVSYTLEIEGKDEGSRVLTPSDIFRIGDFQLPHSELDGYVEEKSIDSIRGSVQNGGDLREGVFTVISSPGQPSIHVPEARGIWAPVSLVLGEEWTFPKE